jgi:protein ImuA
LLAGLRAKVRALEGNVASWSPEIFSTDAPSPLAHDKANSGHPLRASRYRQAVVAPPVCPSATGAWTLGEASFDACLPDGCLDPAGLIELKPVSHGDWPVTLMFAACLAIRRQRVASDHRKTSAAVLWCATSHFRAEHGGLYGPGLIHLGLSPEALILVDAPRETDALWTIEEGVRSKTLSLVVGFVKEAGLTPSRRLGLATSAGETPALLLTSPSSPPAPSAPLRFRLQRLPAGPDVLNVRAPGTARLRLTLERCRGAPAIVEGRAFDLEWCDVTYRFRMAADVADRASRAPQAGQRA